MKLSKEELLDLFEEMVLIREFERKVYEFATTGVVRGSVHLCIGEEAAAVGTVKSIGQDDYLLPTHRGHGMQEDGHPFWLAIFKKIVKAFLV